MIIVIKFIKDMVAKLGTYVNGAKFETCDSGNPKGKIWNENLVAHLILDLIIVAPPPFFNVNNKLLVLDKDSFELKVLA